MFPKRQALMIEVQAALLSGQRVIVVSPNDAEAKRFTKDFKKWFGMDVETSIAKVPSTEKRWRVIDPWKRPA